MELTPTSVGRFLVTAAATGWLVIGSVTRDTTNVREPRAAAQPAAAPAPSFTYSEELRERLNQRVAPEPGRNPFRYGSRVATPAPRREEPVELAVPAMPPAPPAPQIKLSGIAMSLQDGVSVFTAIVIDNGGMVFAKAGDKLSSGLTVERVDERSITLVDAAGSTQTIRLP